MDEMWIQLSHIIRLAKNSTNTEMMTTQRLWTESRFRARYILSIYLSSRHAFEPGSSDFKYCKVTGLQNTSMYSAVTPPIHGLRPAGHPSAVQIWSCQICQASHRLFKSAHADL